MRHRPEAGTFPSTPLENRIFKRLTYILCGGCFLAMLGIILYLVYAFVSVSLERGEHSWLLGIFSDFVEIMNASLSDSPYIEGNESYPPIAIMVLYPFSLICKDVFSLYAGEKGLTVDELTARVVLHGEFWIALILFFAISIAAILTLLILKYRPAPAAAVKLGIAVTCSAPFVYAIMRGNTIYFALIFLLIFLLLYEHKSPVVREIAYFSLVIAGAIKIYPLFFGIFLLRKKRIFPALRIAVYSLLVFLISFGFFQDGISVFLENLGGFMTGDDRMMSLRNLSVTSMLYKLFALFSPEAAKSLLFSIVNWTVLCVIFLLSTFYGIATRRDFSRSLIAATVVILIPPVTYFYVLIFMVIPLMEFLFHCEEFSKKRRITYEILFLILFFTPFIMPQFYIPHALIILALWGMELRRIRKEELLPLLSKRKTHKDASASES